MSVSVYFFHRRIFYVGKALFICHCDSCEYGRLVLCCVVLCDSPVEQHFPWAATGDKIQPLLINNSYPPFIAADTLILAAMIEDNYLVCVIMSLPDAMKRTRRGSGKPSAGGVDYGGGGFSLRR